MTELAKEVAENLPIEVFEDCSKEQLVLEYLKGLPRVKPTEGLLSCFAGSDIISFFDTDLPETLYVTLSKSTMRVTFVLGPKSSKIALSKKQIKFNFVGINEVGYAGIISGTCVAKDFRIGMGIDDLSIEVTVDFNSSVDAIDGWVGGDYASQVRIKDKVAELYAEIMKSKGAYK